MHPDHEHRSQKHDPTGVHCMHEEAAADVRAMIPEVVIEPPCTGPAIPSTAAKSKGPRYQALMEDSRRAMPGSATAPPPHR